MNEKIEEIKELYRAFKNIDPKSIVYNGATKGLTSKIPELIAEHERSEKVVTCAKDYYIAKEKSIRQRTEESQMEAGNKYMLLVGELAKMFDLQQAITDLEEK